MLVLDRMAIEEAGPAPYAIARAIHDQLGLARGPTPIREIAFALDIFEIRVCELFGLEGALVMDADRDQGAIVVNSAASPERRNYTIAHELLHFLNPRHRPPEAGRGFACTRADMGTFSAHGANGKSAHYRQEAEANRFAIEVLAPAHMAREWLGAPPDLVQVLDLARGLQVSKEAAALRLVELSPAPAAMIFTRNKVIRYSRKHRSFPRLTATKGQQVSGLPLASNKSGLSRPVEVDAKVWVRGGRGKVVTLQVLWQQDGFAMIMLALAGSGG